MRILLSRMDRIGDLLLSTPAIATVRRSFPDAHITMITSAYNRIVMERNDDVDEVVALPSAVRPAQFGERFHGYDLAIALAPRTEDLALVGASRATLRVGYTYVRRYLARATMRLFVNRPMLSLADPVRCERNPECVIPHEVDYLLDLVACAGARERCTALRLDLRPEDESGLEALPPHPIIFHLAERWLGSGSSLAGVEQLLRDLGALGQPLVVTAAPESEQAARLLAERGAAETFLTDLPFFRWAAVFARARCVVTVDTGATHLASAVRRPTVVAFEHRHFRLTSQEWAPYGVPCALIRKPESDDEASQAALRREIVTAVSKLIDD